MQDRCTVCVECTIGLEIVLDTTRWISEVTLVMWNLVSVRLEIVLVSLQDRCSVSRQTYHWLKNHFRRTRWYSSVTRHKWKLDLVQLEIVLILTQDRCKVYAECTICLEVVLDTPDRTPR